MADNIIDGKLIKSIIGKFDRNAFESFFQKLLNDSDVYQGRVYRLSNIDDRIFECPAERFYQSIDAFFMCYTPYNIFEKFAIENIDLTEFKRLVSKYTSQRNFSNEPWLSIDGVTLYAINNFDTENLGIDDEKLLSLYEKELTSLLGIEKYRIGVGNLNTFIKASQDVLRSTLRSFLDEYDDGISISFSDTGVHASRIMGENEFAGITKVTNLPLQPIFKKILDKNDILLNFEKLIFSDAKESQLEEFIHQHYQEIFGGKYDRISTQLWLKFPELDIGNKERRLDIFMRNVLEGDWELYELKRSNVELTKSISDVPSLVASVNDAIAQMKNYKHILEQDAVKRKLAVDGIEYYEPEINLVIGKKPSIHNAQWRRLLSDNQNGFRILTYDKLLIDATQRLEDMIRVIT
jgi:hypothetical protein